MSFIVALRRWLRGESRRLEPVACSQCGHMPMVWIGPITEEWHVTCWQCHPMLIGSDVWDDSRDEAVRRWNSINGDLVLDGVEVARFKREENDA